MTHTNAFDVILAGGGAAGLSLAYQLSRRCPDLSMLIVDEQVKNRNDHTWCFWSDQPSYLDNVAYRSWDKLAVVTDNETLHLNLAPYRYQMIRAIDFYRAMREDLVGRPGVRFLHGTIRKISESDSGAGTGEAKACPSFAEVVVNEIAYRSTWVFDSRYRADDYRALTSTYHYLTQHFLGWEIETERPVFDPDMPTLFDFRTPQHGAMRFLYVLPFTENRGLVEYTVFSSTPLPTDDYRKPLREYLHNTLGAAPYRILWEEMARIPMTDHPFPRCTGPHILNIGTRGGRVKSSSGYAFRRIQEDAVAIANSLAVRGQPFDLPKPPRRYHTFDGMLLQILYRHGDLGAQVFARLMKRNPIQRVFRFLDEEDNLWENLKVMASVPPWPFIRAWLRIKLLRRV